LGSMAQRQGTSRSSRTFGPGTVLAQHLAALRELRGTCLELGRPPGRLTCPTVSACYVTALSKADSEKLAISAAEHKLIEPQDVS
ncbi:MAG TPA: hypothetical protein VMF65_14000, partial [Acidimicrobiales bacterium]|nr:hypothetical protein [Acidimicrobiales bacterium]